MEITELSPFQVFVDESITNRVFSITALFGSTFNWMRLQAYWPNVLRQFGLSSPFHMSVYESRLPPFDKLSPEARIGLVQELIDAINRTQIFIFTARIPTSSCDAVLPGDDPQRYRLQYLTCFGEIYSDLFKKLSKGKIKFTVPVPIIIDRNKNVDGLLTAVDDGLRRQYQEFAKIFAPLEFASTEKYAGLQAADLIAYEMMKSLDNEILANGKTRKSYDRIVKNAEIAHFGEGAFRRSVMGLTGQLGVVDNSDEPENPTKPWCSDPGR